MGGLERAPTIEQRLFGILLDEKALEAAVADVRQDADRQGLQGNDRVAWLQGSADGYEKELLAIEERRRAIRRKMI